MTPLTERGRRTRERILRAAVDQFGRKGFRGTSVEDVLKVSGTGKSQFYHYFENKADLARAVLRSRRMETLLSTGPRGGGLDSWAEIRAWFDRLQDAAEGGGALDLIGAFSVDLVQADGPLRQEIVRTTHLRRRLLYRGLRRLRRRGELVESADPRRLASFAAAAMEGGLHLAGTGSSPEALRHALDETWAHLQHFRSRAPP